MGPHTHNYYIIPLVLIFPYVVTGPILIYLGPVLILTAQLLMTVGLLPLYDLNIILWALLGIIVTTIGIRRLEHFVYIMELFIHHAQIFGAWCADSIFYNDNEVACDKILAIMNGDLSSLYK